MISQISEYKNKTTSIIYEEILAKNTDANILLQFNSFDNIYLSKLYNKNISVPILNNLIKSKDISQKYKHVDNIFVFNNFEKQLFGDEYNVNILKIPIKSISDGVITKKFSTNNYKKFGYVANLIQDQPILVDIITSFYHSAISEQNIVLFLMIEASNSDIAEFKNNLYKDLGIPQGIQNRILWFGQGVLSDTVKMQFINSVDSLIYCALSLIDNYLIQYSLVNNKTVYSQYQYFDKVNLISSHLRFIYDGSNLVSYLSPNLEDLIKIFEQNNVKPTTSTNYSNTGIMEYI